MHDECQFLSYLQVHKKVEQKVFTKRGKKKEVDVDKFREEEAELFWNIIVYLNNHGLPYDMVLPYIDTKHLDKIESDFNDLNAFCRVRFRTDSNVAKQQKKNNNTK